MWIFEVWVENERLLGNLSLAAAISSLIHLVFVFDLKYSKVCLVLNHLHDHLHRRLLDYAHLYSLDKIVNYCFFEYCVIN